MARSALALQPLPIIDILLVEDMSGDAFLVESLLDNGLGAEYKMHCVQTQAAALAALAKQSFDVCLLDLTLPDTNGFSALIHLQEKVPDMPILILTGVKDTALAKHAVRHGAQDYLLKDEMESPGLIRAIDYAMERKRLEKDLFKRANCDALTGLANREQFINRLGMALMRARRLESGIAVLFIDLDQFKPINDTHGHEAGDEALKIMAHRIRSTLRAYDVCARFGGDEFAVLLDGIGSPRDAAHIAQKILTAICTPMPYHNQLLQVGASIGIAFSDKPEMPETWLQQADTAMYHAKKEGGNSYRFYTSDMQEEARARLTQEKELYAALEKGELRLYYQPYVNPDGEAVMGVEALLRWAHPVRGILSAHEFLDAAEGARLMADIAQWTCVQLYRDIAMWHKLSLPRLSIALNLSASQLNTPELVEWLAPIANKDFLKGHRLAVEIREDTIIALSETRLVMLATLHEMGIELHIDNFGLGMLPINALCSHVFSLLKIDMSFIKNMSSKVSDNVVITIAIMLAHQLGMKAGAVGVHAPWQAATLKAHACDVIQGHLTAQPMTAKQLAGWLTGGK